MATTNKLTDRTVRSAKPAGKPVRLFDGAGLYLEVSPSGGRYWRLKYRFAGKEKRLALGVYPAVTLAKARADAAEARRLLAARSDPGEHRKGARQALAEANENTFEVLAREWHAKQAPAWAASHADRVMRRLERDVFPWIGKRPVREISTPDVRTVLERIEKRSVDTAHRALDNCRQVLRYAMAGGRVDRLATVGLGDVLRPLSTKRHFAAITDPAAIGGLLRAIDSFSGTFVVRCALQLAPLVFVRPGELRGAYWAEFDLDAATWTIPAERMKGRKPHLVPLSTQAVAILRELNPDTGRREHVFPGRRDPRKPMSGAAINAALQRMGFDTKAEMTGHGFRAMARTVLREQLRFDREVIELQLAHAVDDTLGRAYNRAQFLDERRRMMQAWADHLDVLKDEAVAGVRAAA